MEISERVNALVKYVIKARSGHGCKLMAGDTEHLLDELVGIHTSIAILESSPGVNKTHHPERPNTRKSHGKIIPLYPKPTVLTPILTLFKRKQKNDY